MKSLIGKVVGACQILGELGHGGMGVVYRAKQLSLEREVALKILADRLAGDPLFVERFQREARAIARVNHPNILAVYDVGADPELNLHYMIMEMIDGRNLSEILREKGVLAPELGADYIRQAALGLACAQGAGIIHRDIKPDNIMVTGSDVVKVSDFGLAKEVDSGSLTATDSVMGTPAYMSPEQCDGKGLDGRTDIYSLGGTFYRLITGRLPFEAETAMSMMYRHKHEPLTPPKQVVPAVSGPVSEVIVKMMAKRREDRYQTMDEVAKAVEQALSAPAGATDTERTVLVGSPGTGARLAPGAGAGAAAVHPRRRELERLIAQGDARLRRGDLPGAVRLWRDAKAIEDDPRIEERLCEHALPESEKSKKTGEMKVAAGQLVEAARHYRSAVELNPDDAEAASCLAEIEEKVAKRREALNQVRQLLASNRFEEVVEAWEEVPEDFRDESLDRQVRQVRDVVLPVNKLCDQAEAAMQEGDIERALTLYRRAADVDPQNERARTGGREADGRLGRIDQMLKEGYGFNVKEEYQRAIEAWSGILKVVPDHAQAKKLMVEARLRLGHGYRQKQGGLSSAVVQWKEILKLDPEHRSAQALVEEDVKTQEDLSSLSEEAQAAFSRRKYGRAVACWRSMLDIDPANRKVETAIRTARQLSRKRRIARLAVFLVTVVVTGAGGQLAREWLALKRAAKQARADPGAAAKTLQVFEGPHVFLGGFMEASRRRYTYGALRRRATRQAAARDFDGTERLLHLAKGYVEPEDMQPLETAIRRNAVARHMREAREKEEAEAWAEALAGYSLASDLARNDEFEKEMREADVGAEFVRLAMDAVSAERQGRVEVAKEYWRRAVRLRPGHEAVKRAFSRLGIPVPNSTTM